MVMPAIVVVTIPIAPLWAILIMAMLAPAMTIHINPWWRMAVAMMTIIVAVVPMFTMAIISIVTISMAIVRNQRCRDRAYCNTGNDCAWILKRKCWPLRHKY
ncbi:Hypothetical protein HDN1F_20570 [gamma proteobacterium HdN1]|nr:Hypothetical protein HDN1F_20570 [gamma proteobacterium HdN1]